MRAPSRAASLTPPRLRRGSRQIEMALVVEHTAVPRAKCPWVPGRDVWYADEVPRQPSTCEVRPLPNPTPGRARRPAACMHAGTAQRRRPGRAAPQAQEMAGSAPGPAAEAGRPTPRHAQSRHRLCSQGRLAAAERSRVRGGAGGVGGRGGAALPALHQRQHRQPQGRRALHRCAAGAPRRRACVQRPARVARAPFTSSCDAQPTGARLVHHREALGPRLGLQTARVQPAQPQRGARQRGRHPRRYKLRTAGGVQAGTWLARPPQPSTASTCSRATSTGARPTAAGSLVRDPPASGTLLWRRHHPVRGTAAHVYRQEGRQLKLYGFLLDAGTAALTTAILSSLPRRARPVSCPVLRSLRWCT